MQMEGALQQTIFLLAFWIFLIRIEFLDWKVQWVWEKECGNRSIGHHYLQNVHLENNTLQLNFNPWGPNVPKRDSLFQMIGSCSKTNGYFLATVFSLSSYLTCLIISRSLIKAPFTAHGVLTKLWDILSVWSLQAHVMVATFQWFNSTCNFDQFDQVSQQHNDTNLWYMMSFQSAHFQISLGGQTFFFGYISLCACDPFDGDFQLLFCDGFQETLGNNIL